MDLPDKVNNIKKELDSLKTRQPIATDSTRAYTTETGVISFSHEPYQWKILMITFSPTEYCTMVDFEYKFYEDGQLVTSLEKYPIDLLGDCWIAWRTPRGNYLVIESVPTQQYLVSGPNKDVYRRLVWLNEGSVFPAPVGSLAVNVKCRSAVPGRLTAS